MKQLLERWTDWIASVAVGVLVPWQNQLTKLDLISEYYQPGANILASVLAAALCLASFGLLRRARLARIRTVLVLAIVLLLASLGWTIYVNFTLGVTWFPEGGNMLLIRASWYVFYILVFICLGQVVLLGMVLAAPRRRP